MAKINTLNYQTVAAWNGSQDLFIVEQSDGTKVATPAQVKQYVLGNSIDDIYSVMGQMGAKNLIPYPYVNTSQTINNVAFTVNGDGSISIDNAASAITQFRLYGWTTGISPLLLRKGTYILSGCPSGGSINSLRLYLHNQDSSFSVIDDGEGTQFTLSDDTYVGIAIRVANGYDADGKTVYPMLRLASDTDNTYEPYAKTNRQLTEEIGDLSQTGLTGDSVAAQLSQLNDEIDAIDIAKADTYISPTRDTAQSFNVGISSANRMFLLATGYASAHQFGIVFINYSGTSISYKSIASAALTVDAITYNNGTISITFSAAPYTNARLIRLC